MKTQTISSNSFMADLGGFWPWQPGFKINETVRTASLGLFMRVLSVGFLTAFIPWITLSLLNVPLLAPSGQLAPLLRFQPYNANYESMMAAIHLV